MMNRAAFFASLRSRTSGVFGTSLSQGQVEGIEAILDEGIRRRTFKNHLAYMLATTYQETAHTMQPIYERGGRAYFNKYDAGTPIGKRLYQSEMKWRPSGRLFYFHQPRTSR